MATMIVELYDALRSAGAPEEKARAAAEALARTDSRFDRLDIDAGSLKQDMVGVKGDLGMVRTDITTMKVDLARAHAELAMVKWIVSGVGFGVLLLVLRSFWPGA